MPTIFGQLGDDLYEALCEPDSGNRVAALDSWIGRATAVISTHVRKEITAYISWVLEGRQTEEDWKRAEQKWRRIQPEYHLVMDIQLRTVRTKEFDQALIVDAAKQLRPGNNRTTRNQLFRQNAIGELEKRGERAENFTDYQFGEDPSGETGRSSNDDRSDSLNPNNDAYHAAMDNHANQMNPNNPSYRSSRGR